jgi:hypothetical protein
MMDARSIQDIIARDPLKPGIEHQVGVLRDVTRVIKDYDTRRYNEATGEVFYKPTDSLFDYLTDLLLANHLFGDDIRLEGFCLSDESLHVIISQPFIEGRHVDGITLVQQMTQQGLVPAHKHGRFIIDAGPAGPLTVTDLHEDNAVLGTQSQLLHPIDVHFIFPGREARLSALKSLDLL